MRNYLKTKQNNNEEGQLNLEIRFCIYVTLIANFFVLLGKPLEIDLLVSWPTRITIILPVLLAAVMFFNYIRADRLHKAELSFLGILLFSLLAVAVTDATALLANLVDYMCFLMLPTYGVLFRNIKGDCRIKTAVYIANFAYSLLFIYLSYTDIAFRYIGEYGIRYTFGLTLGYANPNETGMYLFVSFAIMLSLFFYTQKIYVKLLSLSFSGYLFYLIVMTESRMCILIATAVVVVMLTGLITKVGNGMIKFISALPGIAAILLAFFPNFFDNMFLGGENLENARSFVIKPFLKKMDFGTVLFGDFSTHAGENLHNSYFTIFALFGIFTVIIYVLYLTGLLEEYRKRLSKKYTWCAFAAFLGVIIHGIAESTFITAGTVYAALAALLLLLMLPEEEK